MIFKFRMLSDENDYFLREYEIAYDATLSDLHRFICQDLSLPDQGMSSFYLSDGYWNRLQEYTQMDMGFGDTPEEGMPIAMEKVLLGQILHNNRDRLIYQFDLMNDRALFLELTGTSVADPALQYPRVTASQAILSADGSDPEEEEGGSMFDEAMGEFSDFEGDDSYDDEY